MAQIAITWLLYTLHGPLQDDGRVVLSPSSAVTGGESCMIVTGSCGVKLILRLRYLRNASSFSVGGGTLAICYLAFYSSTLLLTSRGGINLPKISRSLNYASLRPLNLCSWNSSTGFSYDEIRARMLSFSLLDPISGPFVSSFSLLLVPTTGAYSFSSSISMSL